MRQLAKFLSVAALALIWSGATTAQDFTGQQDRAAYAGAYFSMSFGGGAKAEKRPVRFGFSAGLRQSNLGHSSNYFGAQFDRRDANITMLADRDWQARVVDLNFSDRGFERFSFSGTAFAQKDALGQISYLGDRFNLDDEGEEKGSGVGKILLWTGAVIGAAGLTLYYVAQYRGG